MTPRQHACNATGQHPMLATECAEEKYWMILPPRLSDVTVADRVSVAIGDVWSPVQSQPEWLRREATTVHTRKENR